MSAVPKEKALQMLRDVPAEKSFYLYKGGMIVRLADLPAVMKSLDAEVFGHHVTKEKNDFANWIHHVVGDQELALVMMKSKSKSVLQRLVSSRLRELKKCAQA